MNRVVGVWRIAAGLTVLGTLAYAFAIQRSHLVNYFGFFTNQTNTLAALAYIVAGVIGLTASKPPAWVSTMRGIVTTYLIVVAVVYNVLVPGSAAAPPWVSVVLHAIFPAMMAVDWVLLNDRIALPWRTLWMVLPYPLIWLTVVLIRGRTDGWVPYGFLLPAHGLGYLMLHIVGLLAALLAAGAVVWAVSRLRGFSPTRDAPVQQSRR